MAASTWPVRALRSSVPGSHGPEQVVEHGLVEADLLGGHAAVVELVDLVGQLGGDLGLGLGAAEHEQAVEGPQRRLGRRAPVPSPPAWTAAWMKVGAPADQAGVGEVEDRPQVAEAVLDRRAGQRQARPGRDAPQLAGRLAGAGS